ncbi:MAG TPA: hypothetical protein VIH95_05860 [Acidimicrobiales bacterium]
MPPEPTPVDGRTADHPVHGEPAAGDVAVDDVTPTIDVVTPGVGPADEPQSTTAAEVPPATRWVPTAALIAYLACRVATVIAVAVADLSTHNSVVFDLTRWDGAWFLRAVHDGYPSHLPMSHGHVVANPIAFFPLFPLVVRAGAAVGLHAGVAALVLSGVTGFTAVWAVGLVARRLAGDSAGARAALLFAVFPGTFVFSFAYSEGIVVTCVAFGLLALLDRRWWLAGVLGAVATAASPVALAFVVSCAWAAAASIRRDRRPGPLLAPLLAPLGFVAYMAYLRLHTGQLNAWRLTERGGWKSYPSLAYPFQIVWKFVSNPLSPTLTGQILVAGTVAAVIGVVLMIREHQPAPVFLYGLCAVGSAAVSLPVGLRPRFLMLAFPLVIAAGTRYSGRTHRILVAVCVVLLALMTVLEAGSNAVFP